MEKKKMFLLCFIVFIFVGICIIATISNDTKKINFNIDGNETELPYETDNPVVAIKIKNYGVIVAELYPNVAPNTVNNFVNLIKEGFYDENTFHRLVPGFVLQGGDPTGTGNGNPGYKIEGEFTENGFTNNLKHTEGILSMARATDYNTAGSQFFIMLKEATHLDGNYATFGKIIDGMNIIKKIESKEIVSDSITGKLANNLIIEKTIVDVNNTEIKSTIKIK